MLSYLNRSDITISTKTSLKETQEFSKESKQTIRQTKELMSKSSQPLRQTCPLTEQLVNKTTRPSEQDNKSANETKKSADETKKFTSETIQPASKIETKVTRKDVKKPAKAPKKRSSKQKTDDKKDPGMKKLTDYFPVRRSSRMCQTEYKKLQLKELQKAILDENTDGLKVVQVEGKGRGVVSTRRYHRNEFVVEYVGDLIDLGAAKQREGDYAKDKDVGCYMYYFEFENKSYCVDATAETPKLGRLLNHSKRGNCRTRVVAIDGRPRLILVASRDVEAGEELLYDYGDRNKETLAANPWLKS